jgi:muconolactone D-isomerase
MEYLVDFTIIVPDGTPPAELEERSTGEGARVAELAEQGHALRVWKPLPEDGRWRALGLYRADDDAELQTILESLPLYPWMEITIQSLAEHPNDPAMATRRARRA